MGGGDGMISLTGTFPLCGKAARLAEVSVEGKGKRESVGGWEHWAER